MASEAFQDPSRGLWASKTGALLHSPSGCKTLACERELWEGARPQAPSGPYKGQQFCVTEENKSGLKLEKCTEWATNQMFDYYDGKLHQRARGDCLAPKEVENFFSLHGVDCDDAWTRWVIN